MWSSWHEGVKKVVNIFTRYKWRKNHVYRHVPQQNYRRKSQYKNCWTHFLKMYQISRIYKQQYSWYNIRQNVLRDFMLSFGLETLLSPLLSKELSIKVCFVLYSLWLCNVQPHSGKECWLGTDCWRAYLDLRELKQHRTEEILFNEDHYKTLMKEDMPTELHDVLLG
jgi:hypothetical protein